MEVCGDLIDNNCNGQVDEGCGVCAGSETKPCAYTGPSGTENKGICKAGTQTCVNGQWGACEGEVTPVDEVCGDNKDNNCDGNTDEGCVVCTDMDGDGYYAYNSTSCQEGNDCNDFEINIHPGATEKCDTIDNNCNGQKDETCMGGSCSNMSLGSTANPGSGNLYHDQTLFNTNTLGFTLSYNSIDNFGSPLGKGWTHNYNLLLFGGHAGSLGLKQGDGRIVYFRLDNGIYYPDTSSGEDSYISYSNGAYTLTEKGGTTYNFNTSGKLISIRDRNGNTTTLTYNGDNLTGITDPSGRTIYITTGNGKITSITTPDNKIYRMTYSGDLLVSVTDPTGLIWQFAYDADGRMQAKTDPQGYVTTYAYDNEGRVTSSIDPEGRAKSVSYDLSTNTATVTEKDGGVWTYGYDPLLNVTTQKTDPQGNVTTYQYDSYKNLISTREADGSITSYTYDEYGNMASVTDPAGNTTSYTYNEFGQVTSATDSEGNTTGYTYDTKGNLLSTTDPTGAITQYVYDSRGNVIQITNSNSQTTTFTYDQYNNLSSITDSSGATMRFIYDSSGNMIAQMDASGNTTEYAYDSLNRLIKLIAPSGVITQYAYDSKGNRTSVTDGNLNIFQYAYNYKDQLTKVIDPLTGITTYEYGGTGCPSCGGGDKLTAITDARGNRTTYEYDTLGRLTRETDSLGKTITYFYDVKGNLTTKTDSSGNIIKYTYDALSRLIKKTYPDGTTEEYRYDSKGNIIYAGNQWIAYNFAYDSKGRLIAVTDSNGKIIQYEYDVIGNRTKMITPEGKVITYKYDSNNRLTELVSDAGTFKFTYDSLGRRIKMTLPNGTYATYSYDTNGRLTNLIHKTSNGSVISSFAYTHDNVGNRIIKTTPDKTIAYQYDGLYRLIEALSSTPGNSSNTTGKGKGIQTAIQQQKEFFTYDAVGNRLTSDKNKTYSYNAGNQLITENGIAYNYDKNGNLVSKTDSTGTTTYSYDFENRLTKVITPIAMTVEFKYDPFGRRIEKKLTENGIATVKKYFYDNEDILFEYDGSGNIGNRYIHGLGIDEPLAMIDGKNIYYYHADGLGSIVALTDTSQKVVQTYEYDSFGNLKDQKERIKQPYTFTGREWDKEIKLYFNRARYRDPYTGIFITKDPILHPANGPPSCGEFQKMFSPSFESLSRTPKSLNPYVYAESNPITNIDPNGLAIYVCNRKTTWDVGNHAYLWDDSVGTGRSCGWGPNSHTEQGPAKDSCYRVAGSEGREKEVMGCCESKNAKSKLWLPGINDCHNLGEDCIAKAGLKYPGAPGGRLGQPCDTCPAK